MKKALISGVTGQDGCLLAALLLEKGYHVVGTSRNWEAANSRGVKSPAPEQRITTTTLDTASVEEWQALLDTEQPDEIYHLAAATSVGASFARPWETLVQGSQNALAPLEALRQSGAKSRLFVACSTECFGDSGGQPITEATPLSPRSPYGIAKAQAWLSLKVYRESYGLWACAGIFSNHESALRGADFVTGKIAAVVHKIARGDQQEIRLGNLDVERDWGWAEEYVEAAWRMLQADHPQDYVVATGSSIRLSDFAEAAFAAGGLNLEEHLIVDAGLYRPGEIQRVACDPARIEKELGWKAQTSGLDVARRLVADSS